MQQLNLIRRGYFYNHMTNKEVAVAVAILIKANGEFLLAQRPEGKVYAGWWEFPGGKVEPNESVIDALKRELHEELGVDVTRAYPWLTIRHSYEHANVRLHVYRVTQWHGEPHGKENQAFQWQSIDNLTVAPLLPAAAPMIKALALPPVYAISNVTELGEPKFFLSLGTALENNLKLIQVREKNLHPKRLNKLAQKTIEHANTYKAKVLINSDVALAKTVNANGVHLTSAQLFLLDKRPDLPLVGASCHNQVELQKAAELGCDFVVLGPIMATLSHPDGKYLGWEESAKLIKDYSLPVYALGGMFESDIETALINGFHGVAIQRGLNMTPKIVIGIEYLHMALRLFYEGESYFSVLHLAGAAEEILGAYLENEGIISASNEIKKLMSLMSKHSGDHDGDATEKNINLVINFRKNSVKHMNHRNEKDKFIHFNAREEAKNWLDLAVSNYVQLMSFMQLPETDLIHRFRFEG